MKKFMSMCALLVVLLCVGAAKARAVTECPHTVKTWVADVEKTRQCTEEHEIIVSEIYRCTQCNVQVEVIISKTLVGHSFERTDCRHVDGENKHMFEYTCGPCGYKAYRYEPCYGPPCAIYWE